jgi:hypothetical protein
MNARGATATAEALYEAWGQLRSVPPDSQSGLRIVVLFTDGSPNAFPGLFRKVATSFSTCSSPDDSPNALLRIQDSLFGTICALDYPLVPGHEDTTAADPYSLGLFKTYEASSLPVPPTNIGGGVDPSAYQSKPGVTQVNHCIPYLPLTSFHQLTWSGMPSAFPIRSTLPHQRPIVGTPTADGYPDTAQNAYNAARNLAETIADAIRSDTSGSSRIRIYTLGLGDLLEWPLGSPPQETGSSILRRIANDPSSPDYNPDQLDGRYYYAGSPAELEAAFQAVRDQIVRLTQ